MRLSSFLFLAIILASPSFAQTISKVTPGSDLVSGDFIAPYTNKWKVVIENANGNSTDALIWTDYSQIMEVNGTKYIHRVQDLYSPDHSLVDTWINMTELETLKPWQFQAISPTGSFSFLEFSDESVIIRTNRNNQRSTVSDTMKIDTPLFDWNLYGMLLVGLPFEKETKYSLPIWQPGVNQPNKLTVTVEGKETIQTLSNQQIETFKLTTDKGLTFWLSKEAPYVIQLQLNQPNGARRMWYMF